MWANVIPYFAIARFLARVRQFWNFNLENLIRSKNEKIVAKNSQRPEKILIKAKIGPPFAMYQLDIARSNENRKINRNLRKILSKSVFFFQDNKGAIAMVMAASIAKGIKVLLKNGSKIIQQNILLIVLH